MEDVKKTGCWRLLDEGEALQPADQWLASFAGEGGAPVWDPYNAQTDGFISGSGEVWRRWEQAVEFADGATPVLTACMDSQSPHRFSRRDIAALALQGILANDKNSIQSCADHAEYQASIALHHADALVNASESVNADQAEEGSAE